MQLLKLLMERRSNQGYFPQPTKSCFIADFMEQEEAAKRKFVAEGLEINFVGGRWYLGAYLGPQEELEAWVKPQVTAWYQGVRVLGKISWRHPQTACAGLTMSLQLKWKCLKKTVPDLEL